MLAGAAVTDSRGCQRRSVFSALEGSRLYAPGRRRDNPDHCSSEWAAPISRLLAAGYSFVPRRYTDEGFLFRGMESGIRTATVAGMFSHFYGTREESRVERIMDVCFLTHEIRDALTVSDMGKNPEGGILVLAASYFNRCLAERKAAVMAIGDSGMVFNYPFVTAGIPLEAIDSLVVTGGMAEKLRALPPAMAEKLVVFEPRIKTGNEEKLKKLLLDRGIRPATLLPDTVKPRRSDLVTA